MQTVTRQAQVQLSQDTVVDAHARRAGRHRGGHGHGRARRSSTRHGDDQERDLERADQGAAGRPGIPRPHQADPGRAVHAGHDARTERRRQRPGQRLSVRRRQRDAAALRHAVGRAGVARHRADDDDQGRRARRWTSTAPAASRSTRSASRAPTASPGRSATSSRTTSMAADAQQRQRCRATSRTRLGQRSTPAGPIVPNKVFFYGSYYRPNYSRDNQRQRLRRPAATTRATATKASAS